MPFAAWGGSWAPGKVGKLLLRSQLGTPRTSCFFLITDLQVPWMVPCLGKERRASGLPVACALLSCRRLARLTSRSPGGPVVLIWQWLSCRFSAPRDGAVCTPSDAPRPQVEVLRGPEPGVSRLLVGLQVMCTVAYLEAGDSCAKRVSGQFCL